jgi:hypothetical protein
MTLITIGLDLAKLVFQVHGVDESGRAVLKRKLQGLSGIPCAGHDDGKKGPLAWHDAKPL